MKKRTIALVLALALVVGGAIGGTIAWLTATTTTITNTFTVGDINIELTESTGTEYPYIPGKTMEKDPKVTVKSGSENAYVFLKVTVENNVVGDITVIQWAVANGWNYMVNGVATDANDVDFTMNGTYYFYRTYTKSEADVDYQVLAGGTYGQVTANSAITKNQVDTILESTEPTLSFAAAAVQSDNIADLAAAWAARPTGF